MIRARRQSLPLWFFTSYFRILQKILFREVEFIIKDQVPEGPVLLLQNHFSWWDGYWSYYISEKVLRRRFHVMMLEKELKKRMFLSRTGAFSVDPEGPGMLSSLRYATGLLENTANVVTIYPQGKIQSHYTNQISFQGGAATLLRLSRQPVAVVFAAAHIRFGSPVRPKGQVFITYFGNQKYTAQELELAYNKFYLETRAQTITSEV
jgi:1-acyl-sn-glycerol-3-phosphate acyltransferase